MSTLPPRHRTNDDAPPARGIARALTGKPKIIDFKRLKDSTKELKEHMQQQLLGVPVTHSECPLLYSARLTSKNNDNEQLYGQKGVFAKQSIAPYTFIGWYAGIVLGSAHDAMMYFVHNDSPQIADYLYACDPNGYPCVSGFGAGNTTSLINDYRPEGFNKLHADALEVVKASRMNCDTVIVSFGVGGIRLPAFFTTSDVPADKQLLTDYGDKFWADRLRKEQINAATRYRG